MRVKFGLNGDLKLQDENGVFSRIGPEHPDYRLHLRSIHIDPKRARIAGIGCILAGVGQLWLNWHLLVTRGYYYLQMVFFGPPIFFMGLVVLLLPANAVPARGEANTRSWRVVAIAIVVLMVAATGLNWYLLDNYQP